MDDWFKTLNGPHLFGKPVGQDLIGPVLAAQLHQDSLLLLFGDRNSPVYHSVPWVPQA